MIFWTLRKASSLSAPSQMTLLSYSFEKVDLLRYYSRCDMGNVAGLKKLQMNLLLRSIYNDVIRWGENKYSISKNINRAKSTMFEYLQRRPFKRTAIFQQGQSYYQSYMKQQRDGIKTEREQCISLKINNTTRVYSQPKYSIFGNEEFFDHSEDSNKKTEARKEERNSSFILKPSKKQKAPSSPKQNKKVIAIENKQSQQNQQDKILRRLQETNKRLKEQIYEVQRICQQKKIRQSLLKKRSFEDLILETSTKDSLGKELSNAYNKIRNYQTEISEIKNRSVSLDIKVKKLENLKQKAIEIEKIRRNRTKTLDNARRKSQKTQQQIKNYKQGLNELKITGLLNQVQVLKKILKELEDAEQKRKQKMNKQTQYIAKIQRNLVSNGVSQNLINEIKNKIIYGQKYEEKIQNGQRAMTGDQRNNQFKKCKKQYILLAKSIKQQQKTIQNVDSELRQASRTNSISNDRSTQLDKEISEYELKISQTRAKINPINMKPKQLLPTGPTEDDIKSQKIEHLKQVRKKFLSRRNQKYLQTVRLQTQAVKQQAPSSKQTIHFSDEQIQTETSPSEFKITNLSITMSGNSLISSIKLSYNHQIQGETHTITSLPVIKAPILKFSCSSDQHIDRLQCGYNHDGYLIHICLRTNKSRGHTFAELNRGQIQSISAFGDEGVSLPTFIYGFYTGQGFQKVNFHLLRLQPPQ